MNRTSNYARYYEKVESVNLSLIWIVMLRLMRGISVGDGGMMVRLGVLAWWGIGFSVEEDPSGTILEFENIFKNFIAL